MPSSYPGSVDDFDEPSTPDSTVLGSGGDSAPDRKHSEHHRDLGDSVVATQTELNTHKAAADPHAQYQREAEKGVAGGYAGLDGGATIPDAQIPATIARDAEVTAAVSAAVAALVNSAPGSLDTLKELADAINDDASFAATMTTALAGKQPLDADLTAIAALATTSYGRAFLALADAAAARAALALGTAATHATGDYDAAGAAAAAQAASQPLDADLTAIAALATTAYGRALLTMADDAAIRALVVGVGTSQLAAGNDPLAAGFNMNGPPSQVADANAALTANRCSYTRCIAAGYATSTVVFRIIVSAGNCAGSFFNSTGTGRARKPNARQQTSGSVAMAAAGDQTLTLGGSYTPALTDFFAFSGDNAGATLVELEGAVVTMPDNGFTYYQDSAHPPPSSATVVAGAAVRAPWMGGP